MNEEGPKLMIDSPWSEPSFHDDERLRPRIDQRLNPEIARWLNPVQRNEIRRGAANERRKLEIPAVIVEKPHKRDASQTDRRGPGATSKTTEAIRAFIDRSPRIVEELLRRETRANAIWKISSSVCGTKEHEKPNRNVYQFLGRNYPLRQTNKRPKARKDHPDR